MANKGFITLKGRVKIVVYDKNGNVKDVREFDNLIVDVGKTEVANLIGGVGGAPFQYIAIGAGTNPPAATDTALQSEVARQQSTNTVNNNVLTLQATFNFTAAATITESGIFNAATGGVMLARQTFNAINVNAGDSLQVTWQITIQ